MNWLQQHWIDLAGLAISILALLIAGSARQQVRRSLHRHRCMDLIMDLREAAMACIWLAQSDHQQFRCDHLGQLLAKHLTNAILNSEEKITLREAVGWFATPMHWDERAQRRVRDLAANLTTIQARIMEMLEDTHG
jgi:hypothetical protein